MPTAQIYPIDADELVMKRLLVHPVAIAIALVFAVAGASIFATTGSTATATERAIVTPTSSPMPWQPMMPVVTYETTYEVDGSATVVLSWTIDQPELAYSFGVGDTEFRLDYVSSDVRSYAVKNVSVGESHRFTVVAFGYYGDATRAYVSVQVGDPTPPPVTNLVATYDSVTGILTTTWSWTPQLGKAFAKRFDVRPGGIDYDIVDGSKRTSVMTLGARRWIETVEVTVIGAHGFSQVASVQATPPLSTVPIPFPVVTLEALPIFSMEQRHTVKVTSSTGATIFVRMRAGQTGSKLSDWVYLSKLQNWRGQMNASRAQKIGWTYCYSARGSSSNGTYSAWSKESCTNVPRESERFSHTGDWNRDDSKEYSWGSSLVTSSGAARVTIKFNDVKKLTVSAKTCRACGTLALRASSGKVIRTISLKTKKTHKNAVLSISFRKPISGTFTLGPLKPGKKVYLDAISLNAR